jgi:cytochrome d ubiquinol oxidase subunit II
MIMHELISFELLRVIWWLLIGVMLIAFALLPFVAKDDLERRVVINTVGPVWEGNQVWFILGGGSIFAAWPPLYAISFSGFYFAMFLILAALIFRPVAFKYRSKRDDPRWRAMWDRALFLSGTVPPFLFGVAVGNVLLGVPFHLTDDLHAVYEAGPLMKFVGLLRPFALLCGVISVAMMVAHGAGWLVLKTEGAIQARARDYGSKAALVVLVGYALAGLWMIFAIDGYAFVTEPPHDGVSNPLVNEVLHQGSWLRGYVDRPWIIIAPIMGFAGAGMAMRALRNSRDELSPLLWSKMAITGMIASVGLVMFPFILPSNINPNSSLTVWDASSSHLTLFVMLICAVIFLPLILLYTAWVYRTLWGKVTKEDVTDPDHHAY